jgi:hypothetical protein
MSALLSKHSSNGYDKSKGEKEDKAFPEVILPEKNELYLKNAR